jgi:hypothetical protein
MAIQRTTREPTTIDASPKPVTVPQPVVISQPPPPPPQTISILGHDVYLTPQVNIIPTKTTHPVDANVDAARAYGANMFNLSNYVARMKDNHFNIADEAHRLDVFLKYGIVKGTAAGGGKLSFAFRPGEAPQVFYWRDVESAVSK